MKAVFSRIQSRIVVLERFARCLVDHHYQPTYLTTIYLPTLLTTIYLPTFLSTSYLPSLTLSTYLPSFPLPTYPPYHYLPTYLPFHYLPTSPPLPINLPHGLCWYSLAFILYDELSVRLPLSITVCATRCDQMWR